MKRAQAMDIPTPAGPLSAVVHVPENAPAPVIVCCHGLLSSKDGSKYVIAGEEFSGSGFVTVRFDFSGCGTSKASSAGSLIGSRVRDLESVLGYVSEQPWAAPGRTGLFGSSMGGYVALLAATLGEHKIGAIACWATPFDLTRVENSLGPSGGLGRLLPGVVTLGTPRDLGSIPAVDNVLVIHGQQDEIVPWKEALDIYEHVGGFGRLLLMEAADHRFSDARYRQLAMQASLRWFQAHLMEVGSSGRCASKKP